MRSSKSVKDRKPSNFVDKSKTCASRFPDPVPANSPTVVPFKSRLPQHEVDFAELEDGTLLELIEDPRNAASSLFAVYRDGTVQNAATMACEDRVLVPIPRDREIFKHVRLPRGSRPYRSAEFLLAGLIQLIRACVDISVGDATLVAAFVMSTWFIESLSVAPYLALVGPPHSGKTTLLQVLNLVCRRSLLTADITSAAFYELYEKLNPTLLVDETLTTGNKRALFHLLKTGTTRGSVTLRKGRSLRAFGPKVISFIELPNDAALNSRCVIVAMQETNRTDLAKPSDKKILHGADALQMELLQFRLENFHSLLLPKIEGDERLHSRTRDLYQALALPVGQDKKICELLVVLFAKQQEINREQLSPASIAVLRVLYEYIHLYPKHAKCANSELTIRVNLNLESLQETVRLNAHDVGRALTSLGFTKKRTNAGFIVYLDLQTRKRIHKLAHDNELDQSSQFQDCELCKNPVTSNPASAETKEDSATEARQK